MDVDDGVHPEVEPARADDEARPELLLCRSLAGDDRDPRVVRLDQLGDDLAAGLGR